MCPLYIEQFRFHCHFTVAPPRTITILLRGKYENMKFCEPLKLRKMVHIYNMEPEWFVTQNFIIIMMLMGGINYTFKMYSLCVTEAMIIIWIIKHMGC